MIDRTHNHPPEPIDGAALHIEIFTLLQATVDEFADRPWAPIVDRLDLSAFVERVVAVRRHFGRNPPSRPAIARRVPAAGSEPKTRPSPRLNAPMSPVNKAAAAYARALRRQRTEMRDWFSRQKVATPQELEDEFAAKIASAEQDARPRRQPTWPVFLSEELLSEILRVNEHIGQIERDATRSAQALLNSIKRRFPDADEEVELLESYLTTLRQMKPTRRIPLGLHPEGFIVSIISASLTFAGLEIQPKALAAQLAKAFPNILNQRKSSKNDG